MPESFLPAEYELHDDNTILPTQPFQPPSAETQQILTYEQFCDWKPNPKCGTFIPDWLNFHLIFCSNWKNVAGRKEVWVRKIRETDPELFAVITSRCDQFISERDRLEAEKDANTNENGISPNFTTDFLVEIQPLIYRAYLIARQYVDSNYELFN